MKTLLRKFIYTTASAALLLSCNFTPEQSQDCATSATAASKIVAKELDSSCKSEEKKLVYIFDIRPKEEINWDYVYSHLPGYVPGGDVSEIGISTPGGSVYNVNGIDMTQEEYDVYKAEYWRKYGEELSKDSKRDLPIPCVTSDYNIRAWTAWLTDGEITELMETYGELAIEDYEDIGFVPGYDYNRDRDRENESDITPDPSDSGENESDYDCY